MGRHRLSLPSYGNQHPPVGDRVDEQRYEKLREENEHSIRQMDKQTDEHLIVSWMLLRILYRIMGSGNKLPSDSLLCMYLLVPAHPGIPGQTAVKQLCGRVLIAYSVSAFLPKIVKKWLMFVEVIAC